MLGAHSLHVSAVILALASTVVLIIACVIVLMRFSRQIIVRRLQDRIDSADALAEKGASQWEREWGQNMLRRAHFARLTGIDVPNGQESLIKLHQKLDESDADLKLIKESLPYLQLNQDIAYPRKLLPSDHVKASIALGLTALFSICAFILLAYLIKDSQQVDWKQSLPIGKLFTWGLLAIYAAAFAAFAWLGSVFFNHYFAVRCLIRKLDKKNAKPASKSE